MMPDLLRNLKSTVSNFSGRVESVTMKAAAVDNGVCDLTAVINSLRSSTATQDDKAAFLKDAAERTEQFLDDVERIDEEAAEAIRQSKDDFYDKYDYLRPDCEKSGWEKFWEGAKEWCKDHWKAIVTVVLVIAAVVVIVVTAGTALGPLAALAVTLAKGVLIGAVVGGLMGGIVGALSPNSTFLEGLESGAFGGAVGGLITGGLGSAMMAVSGTTTLTMAQSMLAGGLGDGITSIFSDLGDRFIKGDDISAGEFIFDALFSFGTGALFSGLGQRLGDVIPPLKINGLNKGTGSWKYVWMYEAANAGRNGRTISLKALFKGLGAQFIDGVIDHGIEFFKSGTGEIWDWYKSEVPA